MEWYSIGLVVLEDLSGLRGHLGRPTGPHGFDAEMSIYFLLPEDFGVPRWDIPLNLTAP
jgi:hypothetical protein